MDVSKRIYSICKYLEGSKLADIGTDHCYLPIFAIKSGKADYAIGVDINEGPLNCAGENIAKEGLEERIELRLGDGFKPVEAGECDTAVISGMGGMLISKIIESELDKALSFGSLILSPQSDFLLLRKNLHKFGFTIYNEDMVKDGAKFYPLIMVRPRADLSIACSKDEAGMALRAPAETCRFDYEFGRIMLENPNDDFLEFMEEVLAKNENIVNNNPLTKVRQAEILEANEFIRGFLRNKRR